MKRRQKRWWAWVLALTLAAANGETAAALTLNAPQSGPGQEAGERVYEVSLDVAVVAAGESLSYLTVSPDMAGNPYAQDYYPGELTVEFTGPVTVAAGGVLSIGKLAAGGSEPSPVLRGELPPEGLIRVEAGGVLWLNGVTSEFSGSGLAIVQEPGAVVEIFDTPLEEEQCQWGGVVVDNRYAAKVEIALAQGDALGEGSLPPKGRAWLNEKGRSEYRLLPMEWDISAVGEQTEGTAVVSGTYLDASGLPIPALLPVEARLRWYAPEEIVLTETAWMGDAAASARLGYRPLPEEAEEIWGELSRDGGKSWERWENCHFDEDGDYLTCTFLLPDATPRQYRLAATDWEGKRIWRSEAVSLPEESDPEDPGGNRGGSTDPAPPSREPEPYDDEDSNSGGDTDEQEPSPARTQRPAPTPPPAATPVPSPEPSPMPPPAAVPAPTPEPSPTLPPAVTPDPTPKPVAVPMSMEAPGQHLEPLFSPVPEQSLPPVGERTLAVLTRNKPSPPPTATPSAAEEPAVATPPVVEEPVTMPEIAASPSPAAEPLPTERAVPAEEERQERALTPGLQALLAAIGLTLCVLVGVWAARGRAARKKT